MDVKEIAVSASIVAGGTGAGGAAAYAANSTGLRFNAHNITELHNAMMGPLSCVDKWLSIQDISKLNNEMSNKIDTLPIVDATEDLKNTLEVKEGCLNVQLVTSVNDEKQIDKKRLDRIRFESSAWNETKDKGVIIWSTLFAPTNNSENKFSLISWVFYVTKDDNGSFVTDTGWLFRTELDDDSTIIGLEGSTNGLLLKNILTGSNNNGSTPGTNASSLKNSQYNWAAKDSEAASSIFDKVKITKGGKNALFFGRDFSTTNEIKADLRAVYKKKGKWKQFNGTTNPLTQSLFKADKKGEWIPVDHGS